MKTRSYFGAALLVAAALVGSTSFSSAQSRGYGSGQSGSSASRSTSGGGSSRSSYSGASHSYSGSSRSQSSASYSRSYSSPTSYSTQGRSSYSGTTRPQQSTYSRTSSTQHSSARRSGDIQRNNAGQRTTTVQRGNAVQTRPQSESYRRPQGQGHTSTQLISERRASYHPDHRPDYRPHHWPHHYRPNPHHIPHYHFCTYFPRPYFGCIFRREVYWPAPLVVYVQERPYYYDRGVFFINHGADQYEAVIPPVGAIVPVIPEDYTIVTIDGYDYYQVDRTLYKYVEYNGETAFEVVAQLA